MPIIEGIEFEEINHEIIRKTAPKLSVWCVAYNEKNYIKECIEGILSQIVNFEIEIIIFDDASTDGTTDIVREYCRRYPLIIHGFIAKKNIYKNPNRMKILTYMKSLYMRGEYAAICEGDDYWCDRNKLQMQVDFLENNKQFVLTMHNAKRINCQTNKEDLMKPDEPSHEIKPEELIMQKSGIWPTASMVGKKEVWLCEPFFFECGVGDWPMQLFAAAKGRIYYFENVMSVYRYMRTDSWSERVIRSLECELSHFVKIIYFLEQYNQYTDYKYTTAIQWHKLKCYEYLIQNYQIPVKDFLEKCETFNDVNDYKYELIIKNLKKLYRQNYENFGLSDETKEFALKQKHLFIMGTGKYGAKMAGALNVNNIEFDGFVVSDDKKADDFYMGKRVLRISDIPHKSEEYGIIVAIYFLLDLEWEELKSHIEECGVKEYICPYIVCQ